MTKDGKENRFGRFIFEDEQAERVAASDLSAVWEFIKQNEKHLLFWARQFIRNRLAKIPNDMHGSFYKPAEFINQIYVDFPFYNMENEETLGKSIYCSFLGISCGGSRWSWKHRQKETSLDALIEDSEGTLKDLLPSRDPIPSEALEQKEHMQEIAPRYFYEIGRLFKQNESGATIGEIIAYNENKQGRETSSFQDVIEEIFFGMTFEEVEKYAKRTA